MKTYIRDPRQVFVAFGLGLAGLLLKWNNYIDFGGININDKEKSDSISDSQKAWKVNFAQICFGNNKNCFC